MSKKLFLCLAIVVLVVTLAGCSLQNTAKEQTAKEPIKIGVITDLTGPAAYWGESARLGAEQAKQELASQGYGVDLVFEDYQLDANKALTSAQKLINVDNVDAVYAEFNPAAISVNSFLKDKSLLFVYDAAVASPLQDNPNAFKTYLDYRAGCHAVAQKFKDKGIGKLGMLKINLEAGELCLQGAKEVYGDSLLVESFDLGDIDLKTQILKLKNSQAAAVINVGFEGDTLNALKAMKESNYAVPYGTVDDAITDNVKNKYQKELKGAITFGFAEVGMEFKAKIDQATGKKVSTYYGAALAYTHIKQMAKALVDCDKEISCVIAKMEKSESDATAGFNKFNARIADLSMMVKEY